MKSSLKFLRRVLFLSLPFAAVGLLHAQPAPVSPPNKTTIQPAPTPVSFFELPRLKSQAKPGDPAPLAKTKITVDDLSPQGTPGAKTATKQNISYLALDAAKDYTRPLRGSAQQTTFVSFLAYASDGTTLDIGGAQLSVVASKNKPGFAQIFVAQPTPQGSQWRPLGELMKIEQHDKAALAALAHLTVRLDPSAHVWDLYSYNRLVAEDVPLPESKSNGTKQFVLHAGKEGAMVMSLISSDENPLFEDINGNDRTQLAQQWKENQRATGVKPWPIRRPLPDDVPTVPPK
jgi:hypothetical protein